MGRKNLFRYISPYRCIPGSHNCRPSYNSSNNGYLPDVVKSDNQFRCPEYKPTHKYHCLHFPANLQNPLPFPVSVRPFPLTLLCTPAGLPLLLPPLRAAHSLLLPFRHPLLLRESLLPTVKPALLPAAFLLPTGYRPQPKLSAALRPVLLPLFSANYYCFFLNYALSYVFITFFTFITMY